MGFFLHQACHEIRRWTRNAFATTGRRLDPKKQELSCWPMVARQLCAHCHLTLQTPAKDTVRRIVESRQQDGQLRKSGLSRSEVELVVQAFVKVWRRMRHRRIPYPIPARPRQSA